MNKPKEDFEELAHAYQEAIQPPYDESWGKGYWKGIEFSKDFIKQLRQDTLYSVVEKIKLRIKGENAETAVATLWIALKIDKYIQ